MRLFVAVALPQRTRASLASATSRLLSVVPGFVPVGVEAMHVTLRFLGEVGEVEARELRARLARARLDTSAFTATLGGGGQFPPRGRPRVLFVGFRSGGERLSELWREVQELTAGVGEEPAERSFSPHVTVARNKRGVIPAGEPAFREFTRALDDLAEEVPVAAVGLYESLLRPGGPRYTLLEEVRCAP